MSSPKTPIMPGKEMRDYVESCLRSYGEGDAENFLNDLRLSGLAIIPTSPTDEAIGAMARAIDETPSEINVHRQREKEARAAYKALIEHTEDKG